MSSYPKYYTHIGGEYHFKIVSRNLLLETANYRQNKTTVIFIDGQAKVKIAEIQNSNRYMISDGEKFEELAAAFYEKKQQEVDDAIKRLKLMKKVRHTVSQF